MDIEFSETTGNVLIVASPEEVTVFALSFAQSAVSSSYVPAEALMVMREFTASLITNVVPHLSPSSREFLSDIGIFFTDNAINPDVTDIEPTDIRPLEED